MRSLLHLSLALLLAACGGETPTDGDASTDGGGRDGSAPIVDAHVEPVDGAPGDLDAGELDAGDLDAEARDAGDLDAGAVDAGPPPRCVGAPDCTGVTASPTEHRMESLDGCSFVLDAPGAPDPRVDALVARAGGARTISDVLGALNRTGRAGISTRNADRMSSHAWVGFRWNDGDETVDYWYPQGITGSSDANAAGRVDGRRVVLVSWYHNTDARPTKGTRLSLVDFTDPTSIQYRHLLLVTPSGTAADPSFVSTETGSGAALHAGGIVWFGDRLYVADTTQGFRVFDLSRIFEPTNTDDTERIGFSGARSDAHGYRYAVPQIARYQLASDSCPIRFSFVGLDRSESPPVLVSGEYHSGDADGRVARWALDPATGWLAASGGRVYAVDAALAAQTRMQGGVTYEGVYYLSSSSQTASSWGRLYRTRPGLDSAITAWPYGCEDLYVERAERLIWTTAEHPGTRDTLGIPLQGR
ncbi:MAG: hypothetical protein H6719_24050 [Sandaracinaceae bacterium]|nr:hypothetical protein [Sandaracinaceae bacterium]